MTLRTLRTLSKLKTVPDEILSMFLSNNIEDVKLGIIMMLRGKYIGKVMQVIKHEAKVDRLAFSGIDYISKELDVVVHLGSANIKIRTPWNYYR